MSKITESARGEHCQIRIPGWCNNDPETTVLCHWNGAGMGRKHPDFLGAYGCSTCHDIVDGRKYDAGISLDVIKQMHLEGIIRTQLILHKKGLL